MKSRVDRRLLLGDFAWQFPTGRSPLPPIVVVPLTPGDGDVAVELIRSDEVAAGEPWLIIGESRSMREFPAPGAEAIWVGTALAETVRAALLSNLGGIAGPGDIDSLAPLAVTRTHHDVGSSRTEVLACTRLRAGGALFTRVARTCCDGTLAGLVEVALAAVSEHQPHVLTETECCTGLTPNTEIETKLALSGRLSPWALATRLSRLVGTDALPGFIPDLGNEMQRWQSYQRTWEVLAPLEEAGYLALLYYGSGGYALKRKRFQEDGLRREETFRFDLDVPDEGVNEYIRSLYPDLQLRTLPAHRRSKFDVNVESTRTGHFYGIEIDEIVLENAAARMSQLEIEYHRSRIHDGLDRSSIEAELLRLTELVQQLVTDLGERPEVTFYSKLSFLRDMVEHGASPYDLSVGDGTRQLSTTTDMNPPPPAERSVHECVHSDSRPDHGCSSETA
jgi:hypothetical protein